MATRGGQMLIFESELTIEPDELDSNNDPAAVKALYKCVQGAVRVTLSLDADTARPDCDICSIVQNPR